MAIYRENIVDIELNSGTLHRSFLNHAIGEGDDGANRFGVRTFRNGEPVSLTGSTAIGYFIRADGTTLTLTGTTSGNEALVGLPRNCYAVEGQFTLAIKLVGGNVNGTMRIIDGTVVNTTTGNVIDPGGTVPDINALMTVIERAEAAAEDIAEFDVHTELIEGNDYAIVVSTTTT